MDKLDRFDNFKFAFPIYKEKDDNIKQQFQNIKRQFKIRYKDMEIEIKEIDSETFLVKTGDLILVFTIISGMVYQMYY